MAALGLFVSLGVVAILTFRDFGITWDEPLHAIYGELVLSWYRSLFQDRRALSYEDLWFYGPLFDVAVQLATRVSPLGDLETRHLMNALFGLAGIAATYGLGALVGGPRAGFLGALLLALSPTYAGHAFANPKDVPFAALQTLALACVLRAGREVPRISRRHVMVTGLALGASMAVRVGGVVTFGYLLLHWGIRLAVATRATPRGRRLRDVAGVVASAAAVGGIAWATMVASWPWAQVAPVQGPLEALRVAARFPLNVPVLFAGKTIASTDVPWTYLPTWFGVTVPDLHLALLAAGAVVLLWRSFRGRLDPAHLLDVACVALAAVLPIAIAIALGAVLYDAHRHFLFVFPLVAALAGSSASALLQAPRRWVRVATWAVLGLGCAAVLTDMAQLHPYEYVYFNRTIAGGLPGSAGRFETDYWGASYREGVEWVISRYGRDSLARPLRVANCSSTALTQYWIERDPVAKQRFEAVGPGEAPPDLFLATTRFDCHLQGRAPIHVVERQGTPLLYVFSLTSPPEPAPTR